MGVLGNHPGAACGCWRGRTRAPPPPDRAERRTVADLGDLVRQGLPGPAAALTRWHPDRAAAARRPRLRHHDDAVRAKIRFWDAGATAYRWIDLISGRLLAGTPTTAYPHRVYTYVALAIYDATIATWESKYHYRRPRPSEVDDDVRTALPVPMSPSYPSEHAAAAQAAATVLAHFLPAEAASFQAMAEEAGWSRVQAGLQYPSDYLAGLELGRKVAEEVIKQADADGSSMIWGGTVPDRSLQLEGHEPRQRDGRELDAPALELAERVQAAGPASVRLGPGRGRDAPRTQFPPRARSLRRPTTRPSTGRARRASTTGPTATSTSGCSKTGSTRTRRAPRGPTRSSPPRSSTPSSRARTGSSPTGTSGRPSSTRASCRSSRSRTSRATRRTTRRSPPHGPRSSPTCSRLARTSSALSARRPAIRGSGPGSTTRWTTSQASRSASPWPRSLSTGRRPTARSDGRLATGGRLALERVARIASRRL